MTQMTSSPTTPPDVQGFAIFVRVHSARPTYRAPVAQVRRPTGPLTVPPFWDAGIDSPFSPLDKGSSVGQPSADASGHF